MKVWLAGVTMKSVISGSLVLSTDTVPSFGFGTRFDPMKLKLLSPAMIPISALMVWRFSVGVLRGTLSWSVPRVRREAPKVFLRIFLRCLFCLIRSTISQPLFGGAIITMRPRFGSWLVER